MRRDLNATSLGIYAVELDVEDLIIYCVCGPGCACVS